MVISRYRIKTYKTKTAYTYIFKTLLAMLENWFQKNMLWLVNHAYI